MYYTFRNGIPEFSATYDRTIAKLQKDTSPIELHTICPLEYTDLFLQDVHPKLSVLFKG
jgi:hypothetical protein